MPGLTLSLVTPDKDLLRSEVDQVTAPSVNGEVGILPGHLPLLADLAPGPVGIYRQGDVEFYAISGGFLEVERNTVTILAETAEPASAIDAERSQRALGSSENELQSLGPDDPDYQEHRQRAQRARIRLQVASTARQ